LLEYGTEKELQNKEAANYPAKHHVRFFDVAQDIFKIKPQA